MNHLFKLLSGYIRLRLTGRSPERFFNLCGASGLEIWDASFERGSYLFSMKIRDFLACRPFVRKAGVRVRIQEKRGLPFFFTPQQGAGGLGRGICGFFSVPVRDVFFCVGYRV